MTNIFDFLATNGVTIEDYTETFEYKGRPATVTLKKVMPSGKRGPHNPHYVSASEAIVPQHNASVIATAKEQIEITIAQEETTKLEAANIQNERVAELERLLAEKEALHIQAVKVAEKARKAPLLRFTAKYGIGITGLLSIVLAALTFVNAQFFLGSVLHWGFLATFAILMGGSFTFFALSKNNKASKLVLWIIPFDLVIAAFFKPMFGEQGVVIDGVMSMGFLSVALFVGMYGFQLWHIGASVINLFSPRDLSNEDMAKANEATLESIM